MRIISLVPSWTEFLFDIGAGEQVVGKTKFCIRSGKERPDMRIVGGTKQFHVEVVKSLRPDLIIASKEENGKELVEQCQAFCEVLLTDVKSLSSAWHAMGDISDAVNHSQVGKHWIELIQSAWDRPKSNPIPVSYAIWANPFMWAGPDTFIHHVLEHWGLKNCIPKKEGERYPIMEWSHRSIRESKIILLSSEPFPFKPRHLRPFQDAGQLAQLVDGEAFSWYGSRMLHCAPYLKNLSHQLQKELTT